MNNIIYWNVIIYHFTYDEYIGTLSFSNYTYDNLLALVLKLKIWKSLSMLWCSKCCFGQHRRSEVLATAALSCSPSCEINLSNGDQNIDDESLESNKIPRKPFDTVNYIHQRGDGSGERSTNTLSQKAVFYCRAARQSGVGCSWFMVSVLGHAHTKVGCLYNNSGGSLG